MTRKLTEEGQAYLARHGMPSSVRVEAVIHVLDHSGNELWSITLNNELLLPGDTYTATYSYGSEELS